MLGRSSAPQRTLMLYPRKSFTPGCYTRADRRQRRALHVEVGGAGGQCGNAARLDRSARRSHEPLIIVQIVPGQEHRAQDLARLDQVVQIRAAEVAARWAG